MLNVKQGGIKYHFFSLSYDSTWDWTPVSLTIKEHSNHHASGDIRFVIHKNSLWIVQQDTRGTR